DYVAANGAAFAKFGGRFLVRGGAHEAVMGQARSRNVVIEFPSYEDAPDVHVNRTLRELRALGLIHLKRRVLTILDVERMKAFCRFTPNYLHLRSTRWGDRRDLSWPGMAQEG
ncbi:DUF1330 domain-containing protein, partial [Methylobacterium sp. J-026]|uniref:DUF1330 domain-containing protein n=1 Tax=Methylobacterium sp. J-026 TaxID=2836624 RepID=UPI001FB897B5